MLSGAQRVTLVVGALGLGCMLATIAIEQLAYPLFWSLPNAGLEIFIPVAALSVLCASCFIGMLCARRFRSKQGLALLVVWIVLAVPVIYYYNGGFFDASPAAWSEPVNP